MGVRQIEDDYYGAIYGPAAAVMKKHADILDMLHELPVAASDDQKHLAMLQKYATGIEGAKECLDVANSMHPSPYAAERIRKLRVVTDYLKLWFQIQCDMQRFWSTKSPELRNRILANIDLALKLEVIAKDDACGYGSGNSVLNALRKQVAECK